MGWPKARAPPNIKWNNHGGRAARVQSSVLRDHCAPSVAHYADALVTSAFIPFMTVRMVTQYKDLGSRVALYGLYKN